MARDITRYQQLNAQLEESMAQIDAQYKMLQVFATIDGLTGLTNHPGLHKRLQDEYERARRYNTPLSLLMINVDRLKQYNSAFGRLAGDAALQEIARILQKTARACDTVAHYGSEEFAILLPGATSEAAKIAAERARHSVEMAAWPHRKITVSIGVATLLPRTPDADALLTEADDALQRSKSLGRNCVTHASDTTDALAAEAAAVDWYETLFRQLTAAQAESLDATCEHINSALIQAYDMTIESWSRILDCKDKETEGHSERVTNLTVRLMRYLGFRETEVRIARWGAWLHDIGKITVPDAILHKTGPLTDEEWVVMRSHTTVAYEMLMTIRFLGPAIDIPYCHYERWDGSGYPRGLKGEEIPLMARLFAVVDVYDALRSDRPYRSAWPEEKVRNYLEEQAGTQFDPRAVKALLALLEGESNE